jgi:DNA sulfur modification protein DndD
VLLKRVKMTNFRQYHGVAELVFSTSSKRNVTIIHGENGVGKTALLNAIKWAFFATLTPNFRNPKKLVNEVARKSGKTSCTVEVEFSEDDRPFLLQRTYEHLTSKSTLKLYEKDGATWSASLPDPELVINSMLPKEMAEYFFFQGEGSNAVDTGNNQGNLARSIRDILGFGVAEELIDSLKKMATANRKSLASHDKTGESQVVDKRIEKLEIEVASVGGSLEGVKESIPKLVSKLESVEEDLGRINNQDLKELRKKESISRADLGKLQEKIKRSTKEKYSNISKYGWAVFGSQFADASLDFIDEKELSGKLPEPYNKTFVEDILREAVCICGNNVEVGSEGYRKITAMLDKAANPILRQRLTGIRAQIQDIRTLNSVASDAISNSLKRHDDEDEEIQKLKIELNKLDESISLIPEEEINRLQKLKRNLGIDLSQQQSMKGGFEERLVLLEKQLQSSKKELSSLTGNDELLGALKLKQDFLEDLQSFLSSYLAKMEGSIRLHVLEEVNATLDKFSRHDFHIKVSEDDFKFHLKDKDDNSVGQGDGLNLLLNLTITAALINFAAERKNVKDPILNSSTVAPLVIDAPFGVLDTKYRNVVVNQLPDHANQVIFLVSSSQWTEEMEDQIGDRIGAEYCLVLEESSAQKDKELDKIFVRGNEIVMSRYDCDIDRTVIEAVNI